MGSLTLLMVDCGLEIPFPLETSLSNSEGSLLEYLSERADIVFCFTGSGSFKKGSFSTKNSSVYSIGFSFFFKQTS